MIDESAAIVRPCQNVPLGRIVREGDLIGTLKAISDHTIMSANHEAWSRFEPTDVTMCERLPHDLLKGCREYKRGCLGAIYISSEGKYLIKCYDWNRSIDQVGEPRIEYELLCLGQQRGIDTMPKAYAIGYFSRGAKGNENCDNHVTRAVIEERIKGASIKEMLSSRTSSKSMCHLLPAKDVARISLAVARAIVNQRGLNISHCNLSVDNIIVRDGVIGESPSVVLTGFEHAMPIQPSPLVDPVYGVDAVYSAPESFFSRIPMNRITLASDVWSLGAVITTMLAGSEAWSTGAELRCRSQWLLSDQDMDRLDDARRDPIDVTEIVNRREGSSGAERELMVKLARIVEACTEYRSRNRIGAEELVNALQGALLESI